MVKAWRPTHAPKLESQTISISELDTVRKMPYTVQSQCKRLSSNELSSYLAAHLVEGVQIN